MGPIAFNYSGGFWSGQTRTQDGDTIYVSTVLGKLYRLDVAADRWSDLGPFLPEAEYARGTRATYLYGISLTPDERHV
eukprot:gene4812-14784_t